MSRKLQNHHLKLENCVLGLGGFTVNCVSFYPEGKLSDDEDKVVEKCNN